VARFRAETSTIEGQVLALAGGNYRRTKRSGMLRGEISIFLEIGRPRARSRMGEEGVWHGNHRMSDKCLSVKWSCNICTANDARREPEVRS